MEGGAKALRPLEQAPFTTNRAGMILTEDGCGGSMPCRQRAEAMFQILGYPWRDNDTYAGRPTLKQIPSRAP